MKRHNLIKSISVLLVFGNLLFSQEESGFYYYYHLKPEGNNYFFKQTWSFNSIGSFSVYTMNGKHTFEDFVKTNNFITNDTIQDFYMTQGHITHHVVMNLNGDSILDDNDLILNIFYGNNHNFQNKDSILTFMSTLLLDHTILPGHIKTNKLFVKFNMVTKLFQILYCLESETLCVTKLEEYNVGDIDFWTSKRKTFYTTPPNWMLTPKK